MWRKLGVRCCWWGENVFTLEVNDIDTLSVEAKAQLLSFQFCEAELQRMQAQAAVLQTGRLA